MRNLTTVILSILLLSAVHPSGGYAVGTKSDPAWWGGDQSAASVSSRPYGGRPSRAPVTEGSSQYSYDQQPQPITGPAYGLIGQGSIAHALDLPLLRAQYDAGVRLRLIELGWNILQPGGPGDWSQSVAQAYQQRIDALLSTGPDVHLYLDFGIQYSPAWVAAIDPLTDQYGNTWQATTGNGGGANVYWSPTLREHLRAYVQQVFKSLNFRGRLWAVRVGAYGGELLYPHKANPGANESFWAFDATAQAQSPVPGWRPGDPSPNDEARRFYLWYVDNLTGYFNFMLSEIRQHYAGYVAPVTPGAGMWDGLVDRLVSNNLHYNKLGYYGTGNYWQRIYASLPPASQNVLNWCSSVGDKSGTNERSATPWDWSSTKQHAYLAHLNGRQIYAENPGRNAYDASDGADPRTTMQWIFDATQEYGYLGLIWVRQSDMLDGRYASLEQYGRMISRSVSSQEK